MANEKSPKKEKARTNRVLTYADAHPVVVDLLLLKEFGPQYVVWEPETLWREILLTLRRHLGRAAKDKIQAIRLVHMQSSPFTEYEVFEKVIEALNGIEIRFDTMQPPTVPYLVAGVDILKTLNPKESLSDEVLRYCAAVLMYNGLEVAPEPIEGAQKFLGASSKERQDVLRKAARPSTVFRDDNPIDVQARKIREALDYARRMNDLMKSQLARIQ